MSLYDHPPTYAEGTCELCGRPLDPEDCTCPPDAFTRDRDGNAPGPVEDCPVHATGEHAECSESVEHMIDRRMEA